MNIYKIIFCLCVGKHDAALHVFALLCSTFGLCVLSINKRKPYSIALKTTTAKRVLEPTAVTTTTAAQQEWQ